MLRVVFASSIVWVPKEERKGEALCAAHQTAVFCLLSARCVLRPCHISYTSILMALWHTPHSFLWAQNGRWWTSFFRYIVTSVNVSSVTAATGPCAETTSNKNDAPIYFSGDHTPVFWSHRWKNKAVGLWVNSWRIHSHINHNCCGLSVLVCMLSNFNTLTTEWKDSTCLKTVIIFLWFWMINRNCTLPIDYLLTL